MRSPGTTRTSWPLWVDGTRPEGEDGLSRGHRSAWTGHHSPRRRAGLGLLLPKVRRAPTGACDDSLGRTRAVLATRRHVRIGEPSRSRVSEYDGGPSLADAPPSPRGFLAKGVRPRVHA